MERIANFINGEYVSPNSGKYIDVFEPATGSAYASVPNSNLEDVNAAVKAAEKAWKNWSNTTPEDRSIIVHRIAGELESRLDEFAEYESRDTGKPLSQAVSVDIPRAIANFRFFSDSILNYKDETFDSTEYGHNTVSRQPLGVVGCISPWNLPLYLFSWKIAPALVTGNCVVGKPSELTPYTAFKLGEICNKAGLPGGVLNIIQGLGMKAGSAITSHPKIKAISFTGGTKTGEIISKSAAPSFKKLSLELGGKNPNVIFADCDFETMLATTIRSSFSNQGEICLCGSRILIEQTIYDTFVQEFVNRTKELKIGDPKEGDTNLGALISNEHLEKVLGYVDLARNEGGKILYGGEKVQLNGRCSEGWFMSPTIIAGLAPGCRTNQEEIFGPVVSLIPFDTEYEAVEIANASKYGLSATIWTSDITKANRIAEQIDAGVIWINCWMIRDLRTPFGGMKNSGVGREGGKEALDFFTEQKNICRIQ